MAPDEPAVETSQAVIVTPVGVKVWSTIGIKVPVPGLDYTMAEFSFGHERYAKGTTQEDIANAARLADEFNTAYLDKHLRKLLRDIRRIDGEVSHDTGKESPKGKKKGKKDLPPSSVRDRARKRMGK